MLFTHEQMAVAQRVLGDDKMASLKSWEMSWSDLTLGRSLGAGSFGSVTEGQWVGGSPCAVKCLHPERADERCLALFHAELDLLSTLHHPNIVQLLGAGWTAPHIFLILELAERGSLLELLVSPATLSWGRPLLSLARDAARAVQFLHSQRVAHRDVKAENVMVTTAFLGKLSDFGTAQRLGSGEDACTDGPAGAASSIAIGTPFFMAPEMTLSEPHGVACDV